MKNLLPYWLSLSIGLAIVLAPFILVVLVGWLILK